jgi:L-lactate dehydrogenase complex protein LldG
MTLVDLFRQSAAAAGFIVHWDTDGVEVTDGIASQAAYGIADSGSLVLLSTDEPRSRSLLPFVHYTYLTASRILPGLDDLFAALGHDPPSCVAIVTGPSSSGDIEMTLTIGVHGPGEEHIILRAE